MYDPELVRRAGLKYVEDFQDDGDDTFMSDKQFETFTGRR
jgi:hypothetical protein